MARRLAGLEGLVAPAGLFLILVAAAGCAATTPPVLSAAERQEAEASVAAVLDSWHQAAAEASEERYFELFSGVDAVFLGTDATERWTTAEFREYAHPHFEEGDAWAFRATRRTVVIHDRGDVAWFDEELETDTLGPARGSGVLLRAADGAWRIAHYNLTITVPNERFREVRALLESDGASEAAAAGEEDDADDGGGDD